MPVERQNWVPAGTLTDANARLRRTVEVLDTSVRYAVLPASATATLALTWPMTLVEGDTSGGAVTLTFPSARDVPGFRVDVVKVTGANALTANGETVTTWASWISTGAAWRRVA